MRLLLLLAALVFAQGGLPSPVDVPGALPRPERRALEKRRDGLLREARTLDAEISRQRTRCGRVAESDAAAEASCREWGARLGSSYAAYSTGLAALARDVSEAVAAERRARALRCALSETMAQARSLGPQGRSLARGLEGELQAALAQLRAAPPSGKEGAHHAFVGDASRTAKDRSGERELLTSVVVTRDEKTGEVRIDAQSTLRRSGHPESEARNFLVLDASGTLKSKEASAAAAACLDAATF